MATRKKGSSSNGRNVQQRARDEKEQLAERLSERSAELAEQAESLAQHAQEMAMHADQRFRRVVNRRPMTSVWTSFGLGVGLGLALVALVPARSRHGGAGGWSLDDLSGSLGDLGRRAERIGRSAAHQASDYAHDLGHSVSRRARRAADSLGF